MFLLIDEPIDIGHAECLLYAPEASAVSTFVGAGRAYAGIDVQTQLERIGVGLFERHPIAEAVILARRGPLAETEPAVFVGVSADGPAHAFAACAEAVAQLQALAAAYA